MPDQERRRRPGFHDYFFGLAKAVSQRSHDIHTQHGCVLVSKENRIIGTGYNAFPKRMNDASLPTSRPEKYRWMKHSERNALTNATQPPIGATAFITGPACFGCLTDLYQADVGHVYQAEGYAWQKVEQERDDIKRFLDDTGFSVETIKPDYSWLVDMVLDDPEMRQMAINRLKSELV